MDGNSDFHTSEQVKGAKEKTVSFVPDIQLMMYGLGDCSRPLRESAELIETIVVEQMSLMLSQAKEVMQWRGSNVMQPEDILYLLRRNEAALKRFITYIGVRDEKDVLNSMIKDIPKIMGEGDQTGESKPLVWKDGRKEYCLHKLKDFGIEEEDILSLTDVIKEERTARACKMSLNLTTVEYQEFHTARCKSFLRANMSHSAFMLWLKTRVKWNEEIPIPILEILIYMAKETIASLIDKILNIREERGIMWSNMTPIKTSEIQEAMRRHNFQQTLTFAPFSRDLPTTIHTRLLAF